MDRGRNNYAVPPLVHRYLTATASQRPTTLIAVSGEPVFPYYPFKKATPGGIWVSVLTALHRPAALLK